MTEAVVRFDGDGGLQASSITSFKGGLTPPYELTFRQIFADLTEKSFDIQLSNDNNQDLIATHNAIKQLISTYSMHIPSDLRQGLLKQAARLFRPEEFDLEESLPSVDSFRSMLRCFVILSPCRRPNLGLTDGGEFLAAWFNPDARFSIKFSANNMLRWIAFDEGSDNGVRRGSGDIDLGKIDEIVKSYELRWLIDGEVRPDTGRAPNYAVG